MSELVQLALALVAGVPVIGGIVYALVRYGGAQVHKAQVDEREEVIRLQKETIDAFEDRIGAFEVSVQELGTKLEGAEGKCRTLQTALDDALASHARLERYAAPQAVEALQRAFDSYAQASLGLVNTVLERVTAIEGHVHGVKVPPPSAV
jgi:hypothetical protein